MTSTVASVTSASSGHLAEIGAAASEATPEAASVGSREIEVELEIERNARPMARVFRSYSADPEEIAAIGRLLDSPEILFSMAPVALHGEDLTLMNRGRLSDGSTLGLGSAVDHETVDGAWVVAGIVANLAERPALVEFAGGLAIELPPSALVVVGVALDLGTVVACSGNCCQVSCGSGFYACCNPTQGTPPVVCRCVRNTQSVECQAGGPGATTCTLSVSTP